VLISVIIPTYNRAYVLERAIDSVLKQTYQNIELIIIDDASTDNTSELLEKYHQDNRVSVVQLSKNSGVSHARNQGIERAQGEWVAFLDSDDEWLPKKLEQQVVILNENPEHKLIHGEEIWIRRGKRVNPMKKHAKSGGDIFERCLELCLISPSAVMIEKDYLAKVGLFDESFPVCEDYELWLRVTSDIPVGFLAIPCITKYGGHEDQLSQKFRGMDFWRVKGMAKLRCQKSLPADQLQALEKIMKKKVEVLLNGREKHGGNLPHIDWDFLENLKRSFVR